jgi:dephospho-CoA kinase
MKPFLLGLTGSIGMGKTTTANMFRDAGIPVWDADQTVHELYRVDGEAVEPIRRKFPTAVEEGAVSRDALKKIIATDLAALGEVEAIVHPLVSQNRDKFRLHAKGLVVFDIPLLFEIRADDWLDAVLVVSAPDEVQRERVMARDGMTEAHFADIRSRQLPDDEKRSRADYVIETQSIEQTRREVDALVQKLQESLRNA